MKKKILTALLVGAIALTAAAGLAACGGNGGDAVTEEQWAAAFDNTVKAENYTVVSSAEILTNSVGSSNGSEVTYTMSITSSETSYLDLTGGRAYTAGSATRSSTGTGVSDEMLGEKTVLTKTYLEINGNILWVSDYDETNSKWQAEPQEFGTEAEAKEFLAQNELTASLSAKQFYAALPADGEAKTLAQLYSAFKYSGGKYTATLYASVAGAAYSEIDVTIVISGGYVTLMTSESGGETIQQGVKVTTSSKMSYAVSDIGVTTVHAPTEALDAIDEAMAG